MRQTNSDCFISDIIDMDTSSKRDIRTTDYYSQLFVRFISRRCPLFPSSDSSISEESIATAVYCTMAVAPERNRHFLCFLCFLCFAVLLFPCSLYSLFAIVSIVFIAVVQSSVLFC